MEVSTGTPENEDIVDYKKRPLHHLSRDERHDFYNTDTTKQIQYLYIVMAVLWVFVVYMSSLHKNNDMISWFFVALPIIVFSINFLGATEFTLDLDSEMFRGNFLSFGYLIVVIFINWSSVSNKNKFFRILILALVFIMLSLVDFWVNKDHMAITKHAKSALQTSSLSLLAYSLYMYYLDQMQRV